MAARNSRVVIIIIIAAEDECPSVCQLDISKRYERISMKFCGKIGHGPVRCVLDFGDNPESFCGFRITNNNCINSWGRPIGGIIILGGGFLCPSY